MRNCFDCKFKEHKFTNLLSKMEEPSFRKKDFVLLRKATSVTGDHYGRCLSGHNRRFGQFYKKYSKVQRSILESNSKLVFDCHDYDDLAKSLDACIAATDKALTYFRDKEEKDKKT